MKKPEAVRSLIIERQVAHPPEKVWRALTQAWLIEEWLMPNDFVAEVGHCFTFRSTPLPGWSGIVNCRVTAVEVPRVLAYFWGDGTESENGLKTRITWTLTPRNGGTLLRMEQSGFRNGDKLSHARMGERWPHAMNALEQLIERHFGENK